MTIPPLSGSAELNQRIWFGLFDRDDPDRNPGVLKRIANVSGGEWYLPRELEPIVPVCQKIARDIRSRYTVGYLPVRANNKAAGRTLRVAARSAEGEKLIVRTRTTYRLPERAASVGHAPQRFVVPRRPGIVIDKRGDLTYSS